jgi:hypothetical protein
MVIGRLDNMDKHRLVLAIAEIMPISPLQFSRFAFTNAARVKVKFSGPATHYVRMKNEAELFRLVEAVPIDPSKSVDVQAIPPHTIVFGDPDIYDRDIWSSRTLASVSLWDLDQAADVVAGIVESFASEFS